MVQSMPKKHFKNKLHTIKFIIGLRKEDFEKVSELVNTKTLLYTKEVLTRDETAKYMGVSKSYIYKLTRSNRIPHYKPNGKMCYFNREELETWLQNNQISTTEEINSRANAYCMRGGKV